MLRPYDTLLNCIFSGTFDFPEFCFLMANTVREDLEMDYKESCRSIKSYYIELVSFRSHSACLARTQRAVSRLRR